MSVEALKAEVKANFPVLQAIKAADTHFSSSHRTYTAVPTEVVTEKGGHGRRGGRRNSHHQPVRDAIDGAKRALDEVRGKAAPRSKQNSRSHNRRSTSGDNEVQQLRAEVSELRGYQDALKNEVEELKKLVQQLTGVKVSDSKTEKKEEAAAGDDDFDLFGSDDEEESEEAERVRKERLEAYAAKKSAKPGPIAKSSVLLDVKPWDDETDLKEMENLVKGIQQDGLVWGATKLVPIGYGIQKLQILATIEDLKVSVDDLIEKIQEDFADHVQSVDIVAFNKI